MKYSSRTKTNLYQNRKRQNITFRQIRQAITITRSFNNRADKIATSTRIVREKIKNGTEFDSSAYLFLFFGSCGRNTATIVINLLFVFGIDPSALLWPLSPKVKCPCREKPRFPYTSAAAIYKSEFYLFLGSNGPTRKTFALSCSFLHFREFTWKLGRRRITNGKIDRFDAYTISI